MKTQNETSRVRDGAMDLLASAYDWWVVSNWIDLIGTVVGIVVRCLGD